MIIQQFVRNSRIYSKQHIFRILCTNKNDKVKDSCKLGRFVSTQNVKPVVKEDFAIRFLKKVPFLNISEKRLTVAGYVLYEAIADNINYIEFVKHMRLPDTFYSWFVITELHIWMLSVRCMIEDGDGRIVRNGMIEALWSDVNQRVKKLGDANPSGTRLQLAELSEQLQAALIAYDEGLLSNDCVMAGALWRRVFQQNCDELEHLDILVKYVRQQMCLLDCLTREQLFEERKILWKSIKYI